MPTLERRRGQCGFRRGQCNEIDDKEAEDAAVADTANRGKVKGAIPLQERIVFRERLEAWPLRLSTAAKARIWRMYSEEWHDRGEGHRCK